MFTKRVVHGESQSEENVSQIFGDIAHATSGTLERTIETEYNLAGEILSISDPSATIEYERDALGRATEITNSINGLTPTVTLAQSFNAAGSRTGLSATIGSTADFVNTYEFDALQRLTSIVQQGQSGGNAVTAKHISLGYNALSQLTQIARYQNTGTSNAVATTTNTFDTANRLSSITHASGGTTLASYDYTYDAMSRIASIDSSVEGLSEFSYDAASQLIGADHISQSDESYSFDGNGNRTSSGYSTGTNNRTTESPGYTYAYDDEGNRVSRTSTSDGSYQEYQWDYRNRLTKVTQRDSESSILWTVEYEYDAMNRLVHRTETPMEESPVEQFWAYDEGINAVLEFDGEDEVTHRYLWSGAVDQLLADEQVTSTSSGGNVLWPLADHVGTLRDIADYNEGNSTTSVTNHRTYNAFGKLVSETNSAVDLIYGFTGKQLDEATGLQHNLFRWYDSGIGKWMSEDPLGFAAGDENLSRYVKNQVLSFVDQNGLRGRPRRPNDEVQNVPNGGIESVFYAFECFLDELKPDPKVGPPQVVPPTWVNEGLSDSTYGFSSNTMVIDVANIDDPQKLKDQLFNDIKNFNHFNGGVQNEGTVYVEQSDNVAWFDMAGWAGHFSDWVNADYSPVRLYFDDERHLMVADTCAGHMLDGNRWWTVEVIEKENNHASIVLQTWSVDRTVGLFNLIGFEITSSESQNMVWTNWFENIANAYDGTIIATSAGHHETDDRASNHDGDIKEPITMSDYFGEGVYTLY